MTAGVPIALLPLYRPDPLKDTRHREARAARELADWLRWLELGNTAARTLDSYERVAAALLNAYPHKQFAEFTDSDLAHLLARYPAASRATNKSALNSWFKWGYTRDLIPGNPVDRLPKMRYRPNRHYDVFTDAEVDACCALPAPDGQLMTLLFGLGLRRSEARCLTVKRIDFNRGQVIVTEGAKGSKTRRVPMTARVAAAADELTVMDGLGRDDHLWYDRPGGTRRPRRATPIANSSFDRWWRRCLDAAAVRYRNAHMARHSFATRARRRGMEMEDVQQMLGHESIRTTADTYVHADVDEIGDRYRTVMGNTV